MDAGPNVFGTADDLNRLRCAHLHLTNAQLVGVRVFFSFLDVTDDDPLRQSGEVIDLLFFEAGHRQPLSQLVDRLRHLHEFLEPGQGNPHG